VGGTDQEHLWVLRAQKGDEQAFAQIVEAYQRPVYNLAYRMLGSTGDAEDAAQEVFLRAYRHLKTYDPTRKFSSWILSIASHYCIDRLRRGHRRQVSIDEFEPDRWLPDDAPRPEQEALDREMEVRIARLLEQLPEHHRLAIVLRYWHDLSYTEIAEVTASTESAVKSRLHRARMQMAEALADESGSREEREREHAIANAN
jgi:RNA polymerase sigma-70 factor (ECF subfamily)